MSYEQADILHYYLEKQTGVTSVKVYSRTKDVAICYTCDRKKVLELLVAFDYEKIKVPQSVLQSSGRALYEQYNQNGCYFSESIALCVARMAGFTPR